MLKASREASGPPIAIEDERSRVAVIEPLRGLAALAVAWFHFTNTTFLFRPGTAIAASGQYGWLGVEVFFVISGFIIPYSMYRSRFQWPRDIGTFVIKRMIRLDPPYLVTIGLTLALSYASVRLGYSADAKAVTLFQVLAHLGYVNSFIGYPWIAPVFWTLAVEFQYYLLIAVAFPLLFNRRPLMRLTALAVLCATAFVVHSEDVMFHFAGLFALGILTAQKYLGLVSTRRYFAVLAAFTVAICGSNNWVIAVAGGSTALLIGFLGSTKSVRFAPLTFLGTVSYSLYLLHAPIGGRAINLFARFGDSPSTALIVMFGGLAVSFVASYALYRFVERPTQRWSSSIRYGDYGNVELNSAERLRGLSPPVHMRPLRNAEKAVSA